MIRKKLYLLLAIGALFAGAAEVQAAFTSMSISTFSAGVSLTGNPVVTHVALTQLTTDYYAVISATATSTVATNALTEIYINYYIDPQVGYSTATVVFSTDVTEQYFTESIKVDTTTLPQYFSYRIVVVDEVGLHGRWPSAGIFYTFETNLSSATNAEPVVIRLPPPEISHTPVGFVSAIQGLIVATGTVSDMNGLDSIAMFFRTDAETAYSTYTIPTPPESAAGKRPRSGNFMASVSNAPATNTGLYDFRFELDKSLVDFGKAKNFYYYLKATGLSTETAFLPGGGGVYSAEVIAAKTINLGAGGGTLYLPNGNPADGRTALEIPPGAVDGDTQITITEIDPNDNSVPQGRSPCATVRPVAVYNFSPDNLYFKKLVTMKLLFPDINHDNMVDGEDFKNYEKKTLKMFWWDGFDWRLLGGKNDPELNVHSYAKIKHFSTYALFPVTSMNDNDYRPKERIITPAMLDHKNDVAMFDGLDVGDIVNIYDVNGKRVRQLTDDFDWDGKDEDGDIAESGIYIYQIKLFNTDKIISGVVVIAK